MKRLLALAVCLTPLPAMAQQAVSGIYTATPPTMSDGQQRQIRLDASGALVTSAGGSGATSSQVQGTQADSTAATGNPVNVSGRYTSTLPTLTTGQAAQMRLTLNAAQHVSSTPTTDANVSITPTSSAALESGRVLKASAGNLYMLSVSTSGTAGYVMVFNSTTVPADGAVTPVICRQMATNSTLTISNSVLPARFATGISVAFSSTGCFTKTASATAFIEGYVM